MNAGREGARAGRAVHLDILERVSIASPCPARWEEMQGDDKRRFCGQCRLHVHNLSAMTAEEAAALVAGAGGGRLCATFYRRADGTILTRDCPVGLRAARAAAMAGVRRIAAAVALLTGAGVLLGSERPLGARLRQVQPFATVCEWLSPSPPFSGPVRGQVLMGKIAPIPMNQPGAPGAGPNGGGR